jgi:hypothetical protein
VRLMPPAYVKPYVSAPRSISAARESGAFKFQ